MCGPARSMICLMPATLSDCRNGRVRSAHVCLHPIGMDLIVETAHRLIAAAAEPGIVDELVHDNLVLLAESSPDLDAYEPLVLARRPVATRS